MTHPGKNAHIFDTNSWRNSRFTNFDFWLFYTIQGPHPKGRKKLFLILPQVIFGFQLKLLFFTSSNLTTIKHLYPKLSLKLHLIMENGFRLHFATSFSGHSTFERAILGKWGDTIPCIYSLRAGTSKSKFVFIADILFTKHNFELNSSINTINATHACLKLMLHSRQNHSSINRL